MESENPQQLPRETPPEPEALVSAPHRLPAPEPGSLGSLRPPAFHLALFALTFASAVAAALALEEKPETPDSIGRSLGFAAALLAILLAHEMGHFLLARRHRVNASWPYFLPAPFLSMIGTFGAMIRLRALPRGPRALLDIGAAGPICGFLVTVPILYLGMMLSHVVPMPAATGTGWTLWDSLVTWSRSGEIPDVIGIDFGEPLLLKLLAYQRFGALPANLTVAMHPVLLAGWFGLLVTALNLLPLGQLDGGHILYAISPRLHRLLGAPFSAALIGLGIFTPFAGWLFWGALTGTVLSHHPPLKDPTQPLGKARIAAAILSLAIFVVSFSPIPLALLRA
jgi:membrane-associated protease RseP (regulator of RpoE activity)